MIESYNIFQKWFKDTLNKLLEVRFNGIPINGDGEIPKTSNHTQRVSKSSKDNPVRIWVDIRISNRLHLSPKNLSYWDLVRMVEKLEGLC